MDVISCEGLTKRFGPAVAVNELDLTVSSGQVYGFLGPNGAGKTTTIRMLVGLIAPSAGQIRLLGRRLPAPRAVAQTGSMIEEPAFYPWMSGRVNLEVLGATGGGCAPGEVARVLGLVGLDDVAARKVKTYSQGMRQRLGIAAAMLGRPKLLIIDEPTNGLDPAGIREIRNLLRGLAAEGTTVFLSSHLLAEVEQLCTRVGVLDRGVNPAAFRTVPYLQLVHSSPLLDVYRVRGSAADGIPDPQTIAGFKCERGTVAGGG